MILHTKFLKRFHKHLKIAIVTTTFINMNSWKWMLLPYLLVNVLAALYKNLLLTKCRAFWACVSHHHLHNQFKISFVHQRASSSSENLLNHDNCTIVKSFKWIMNFYSYTKHIRYVTEEQTIEILRNQTETVLMVEKYDLMFLFSIFC